MALLDGFNNPLTQGLLGGAAALLQPRRVGIGDGIAGFMGGANQAQDAELKRRLGSAQIERILAEAERQKAMAARGVNPELTAAINNFQYRQGLKTPQDQEIFDSMLRGPTTYDVGGVRHALRPGMGPQALTSLDTVAGNKSAIAGAEQTAKEAAKARFDFVDIYNDATGRNERVPKLNAMAGRTPLPTEPTPESAADIARRKAAAAKEGAEIGERIANFDKKKGQINTAIERYNRISSAMEKAEAAADWSNTGFVGGTMRNVPGTGSYNIARTLDEALANIGFGELQQMRFDSPTGGALGNVAIQELMMLQATAGSIDPNQSLEQFRAQAREVRTRANSAVNMLKKALEEEEKFVRGARGGNAPAPSRQTGVPQVGTVMQGYRFKGGNPADKNNWEKQ